MKPVSSNNWTPQYKKTFAAGKEDFKPTLISECDVHDPFYFCFNCLKAPTKWKLDLKQTQSLIALKSKDDTEDSLNVFTNVWFTGTPDDPSRHQRRRTR